ncbi:MAG: hypothetical protein NTX32_05270 [Candidatus Firestonebacteria bacterium]|nr:hypothetical protein [Candidatus Firestonebacteria bacterium]
MKKIIVAVSILCSISAVFAGDILGLDISARWYNASGGNYMEHLSTLPDASIFGDFPASIQEATVKKNLLGPLYASGTFRYGTVPLQTMTLQKVNPAGLMTTNIDSIMGGIIGNIGANIGLGPVEFNIYGSGRYMWATKNFYDWKLNNVIVAPGSAAGRFIINWLSIGGGVKLTYMMGLIGFRGEVAGFPLTSDNVDYLNPQGAGKTTAAGMSYMYEGALLLKVIPFLEFSGGYRFESIYFNEAPASNNFDLLIKHSGIFIEGKLAF